MGVYKHKTRGTWVAKFNYRTEEGKIVQKKKEGFKLMREAEDYMKAFLAELEENKRFAAIVAPTPEEEEAALVEEEGILFTELHEQYMRYISYKVKPTTYDTKKSIIGSKVVPHFADMRIKTITVDDVEEWQILMQDKGYKNTYLRTIHNQLTAILNYGIRKKYLKLNVARDCGSMGDNESGRMDYYKVEEFKRFITAFEDRPDLKVIYSTLFNTGLRSGELLALTRRDIDLTKRKINVNKTFIRREGKDLIQIPKTKSSIRKVPIPEHIADMLDAYFQTIPGLKDGDRVFPWTKSHLNTHMKRGAEKSGVKRIRVHDLRHSFASMLINLGVQMKVVQKFLGHKSIVTTMNVYSHLYEEKYGEVADLIDSLY